MAKLKAELETDRDEYSHGMLGCRRAHDVGDYQKALEMAASACEYVDGRMQFEHRYENSESWATIESLDYVFRYAPILFETQHVDQVFDRLDDDPDDQIDSEPAPVLSGD